MKREINSLVEEIYNYSLNLTESRSDLTEIQKKEYFKKINPFCSLPLKKSEKSA